MRRMIGLVIVGLAVSILGGCGDDKSVSSVLEEDYGIRTLKNGSTLEGTINSSDGMHMYLLEVPSAKIKISVTGSKDIKFTIAHKGASEWEIIDTIDEEEDEPDIEVFNENLVAGTYTITVKPYSSASVSYTISASW